MMSIVAQLPALTVGSHAYFPSVFFKSRLFSGARCELYKADGGFALNKCIQSAHMFSL